MGPQEIVGKEGGHSLGQYETHTSFTMPGLVRVTQVRSKVKVGLNQWVSHA